MARSGSGTSKDNAAAIGRAVGLSLAIAGGAAAAYAFATYMAKQNYGERIALGQVSESFEGFLKYTADSLQKGCQTIIDGLEANIDRS